MARYLQTPGGMVALDASTTTTVSAPIARADDWLDLPAVNIGDQKVVLLAAVHNVDTNLIGLKFAGDVTVDWGDGNAAVDYPGGADFEYDLDYADFVGTECSEGYRQAVITITPQSGQNLTQVYLDRYSSVGTVGKIPPILEIKLAGANIFAFSVRSFSALQRLRRFELVGPWLVTSLSYTFFLLKELVEVEWPSTFQPNNLSNTFYGNVSLRRVAPFDSSQVTIAQAVIKLAEALEDFPEITSNVLTSAHEAASNARNLKKQLLINTTSLETAYAMLANTTMPVVRNIDLSGCDNVSNFLQTASNVVEVDNITLPTSPSTPVVSFITGATNLKKFNVANLHFDLNLTNSSMSAAALNQVFTNALAGSYTITVTGSPGAATCDPTIATAKGITVITA